ncbi:uncharacterized protein LOC125678543 [Ostrea edulis]|uniref:uncharacterized protein LOC125678543 n=1 Tax=Ostrea edulis TaxID=37623 RepID=UPI00209590BB|nr:uncharacterized protein LOC125678543 [Ostrea edulis]
MLGKLENYLIFLISIWNVNAVGILVRNQYLDIPALATYDIIGLKGCARQCIKRKGQCVSFNYQKEHLLCHLLDTDSKAVPDKLKTKEGYTYSEIDTWTEDLENICKTTTCAVAKMCLELSSGKTSCQFDPTGCPKGKFFNSTGCQLCPTGEYQPASGQFNCSVCPVGEGSTWKMSSADRTVCKGCWYGIGTYTEGDNPNQISSHTVADRNECFSLCHANPSCLAVKSTQSNTKCAIFSTKTWKYGYVRDSVVLLVRGHCRP